jgi:hypothetical protein
MKLCANVWIVAAGLMLSLIPNGIVQRCRAATDAAASLPENCSAGSILTDRLLRGDQRIWNSIRKIVLAQDKQGRPKHPKLYDLWCTLEESGHEVFFELIDRGLTYSSQAGKFTIERLDPSGRQHICAIRLNLSAIRQAYTKADAMRTDGFLPMAKLGEKERYAEVLGHEMAHAAGILLDPDYFQLYQDLQNEVAEYERHLMIQDGMSDDLGEHLSKIKAMQRAFEKPAEAAEVEIWRELSRVGVKYAPLRRK